MQDIYLDEEFDKLLEEVREVKPDIQIIANLKSGVKDPLSVVINFISNNQDQWLEICQQFDSQGVLKITRTDFVKCLKVSRNELNISIFKKKKHNFEVICALKVSLVIGSSCNISSKHTDSIIKVLCEQTRDFPMGGFSDDQPTLLL